MHTRMPTETTPVSSFSYYSAHPETSMHMYIRTYVHTRTHAGQQTTPVSTFSYYASPSITSISPSTCPSTGGRIISVRGQGFSSGTSSSRICSFLARTKLNSDNLLVSIPGQNMNMTVPATLVSNSLLLCACPINRLIVNQPLLLDVSLNGLQYTGNGSLFVMHAPLRVTGISPFSGTQLGQVYACLCLYSCMCL